MSTDDTLPPEEDDGRIVPDIPDDQRELFGPGNTNLKLWREFEETDGQFTKPVKIGARKFTAIDPTYQKWRATAAWGPYGQRWGLRIKEVRYVNKPDGEPAEAMMLASFYYPDPEDIGKTLQFDIVNEWPWRRGGDTLKCLHTNTIMKALHYLGFSADVWFGRFDDTPFDRASATEEMAGNVATIVDAMKTAKDAEQLERRWEAAKQRKLNDYNHRKVKEAYEKKKFELQAREAFGGTDDTDPS